MPAWPASLPQYPLLAGFQLGTPDTVLRASAETGPPLTRRRFTAAAVPVQCTVKVGSLALKDAFALFLRNDLADGALSFTWAGLSERTGGGAGNFQFSSPPDFAPEGANRWRISMRLLRLP